MTIRLQPIKPDSYTLGGAQFWGRSSRLFSVTADAGKGNDEPIELHVGAGGHRSMIDLSIEEAETLASCLVTAIRLRRAVEEKGAEQARKAEAMESRRLQTFFADSDGALEAA